MDFGNVRISSYFLVLMLASLCQGEIQQHGNRNKIKRELILSLCLSTEGGIPFNLPAVIFIPEILLKVVFSPRI